MAGVCQGIITLLQRRKGLGTRAEDLVLSLGLRPPAVSWDGHMRPHRRDPHLPDSLPQPCSPPRPTLPALCCCKLCLPRNLSLRGAPLKTWQGRCLCRPPFLPLAPVQAEHPAAGSFPGTTGSPGDWDQAWAWVFPVGRGFPGKTLTLSPHTWAGMLGLPPSAQSHMQGHGKGVCPMHGAVPQQGLPCLAGEQDKARIKLE